MLEYQGSVQCQQVRWLNYTVMDSQVGLLYSTCQNLGHSCRLRTQAEIMQVDHDSLRSALRQVVMHICIHLLLLQLHERLYSPVAAATARAVHQYAIPSDAESSIGGDTDDAALAGVDSLQHLTKDELIHHYSRMQQRAVKYRTRFGQVTFSFFCLSVMKHDVH